MHTQPFRVTGRTENHLLHPVQQARNDFAIGRDIGYNPFPIYSDFWVKYREAFLDCQLQGMASQLDVDDDRCKSDYADEYVGPTPASMRHDDDMEDLG